MTRRQPVGDCDTCHAPMLSKNQWWRRMNAEQRREAQALGYKGAHSVGECHPCHSARLKREDAENIPVTTPYTRAELLEEWAMLVDRSLTLRENCRRLAPRLGMRSHAMEKALNRAGIFAWPTEDGLTWADRDEWAS